MFARGGFPDGCFQTLLVSVRRRRGASCATRGSPRPRSPAAKPAGQSVAAIAGDEIKPTVLELGGSDPFIVMPSADVDEAVKTAVTGRVQNNGQSCIAAKRFIVHADIYDEFVDKFVARMESAEGRRPDGPRHRRRPAGHRVGPRRRSAQQVEDAVAARRGDPLRRRASRPAGLVLPADRASATSPRTWRCTPRRSSARSPSVYRAADIDEAIEIANDTTFGLGSNAWTRTRPSSSASSTRSRRARVFINGMTVSYPELPFGGVKRSGYGRELRRLGIREFCNAKTVWVAKQRQPAKPPGARGWSRAG